MALTGLWLLTRKRTVKRATFGGAAPKFTPLGSPRVLGRVDDYGPTQTATFYVGQSKGERRPNQTGSCARKAKRFRLSEMDNAFLHLRAKQVGEQNTGGTRITGEGFFEGKREDSVMYTVIHIPNARESSYQKFRSNMNRLAESMGKALCQDEVILVHSDGNRHKSCGAIWYDPKRGTC